MMDMHGKCPTTFYLPLKEKSLSVSRNNDMFLPLSYQDKDVFSTYFIVGLESLGRENWQKKLKAPCWEKKNKLFVSDKFLHMENLKESTETTIREKNGH